MVISIHIYYIPKTQNNPEVTENSAGQNTGGI